MLQPSLFLIGAMLSLGISSVNASTTLNSMSAKADLATEFPNHALGEMQAGKLRNGQYAALFGNSYDQNDEFAKLYLINLQTGTVIKTIRASTVIGNALSSPILDLDEKNEIKGAYAGDLNGNLWHFDLSSSNPSDWKVAHQGLPIFNTAQASGYLQPITTKPIIYVHPSGHGKLIVFGTGSFNFETNNDAANVQSMYGIWDHSQNNKSLQGTRKIHLVEQHIKDQRLTQNSVDWSNKRGWYFDFPGSREGLIANIDSNQVLNKALVFQTYFPVSKNSLAGIKAVSAQYIIDPYSGGAALQNFEDNEGKSRLTVPGSTNTLKMHSVLSRSSEKPCRLVFVATLDLEGGKQERRMHGCQEVKKSNILQRTWRQLIIH